MNKIPAHHRLSATLALLGLFSLFSLFGLTACGGGSSPAPVTPPQPGPSVQRQGALQAFEGPQACAELEQYLEDQTVARMREQLEAARDGKGYWGGWGQPMPLDAVFTTTSSPAPAQYTTTNLRTAGVDESDIVKNSGTRIVALAGQSLQVLRSWPAEQLQLQGTLKLQGQPLELFLDGEERAVVLSSVALPQAGRGDEMVCLAIGCRPLQSQLRVSEVDLSQPAQPRLLRELSLPGRLVSARKTERSLRLVLADDLHLPEGVRWSPAGDERLWADKERLRAAWNQLIQDNERLLRARSISDWLPVAQLGSGANARALPQACAEFAKVNAPSKLGTVTLATWDLAQGTLSRSSVLAEPGTVYASTRHLYIATQHWWSAPELGQVDRSYIHQFDLGRPERADYLASGSLDGHVGDSFALDEAASGHLRVVSTLSRRVADPANPANSWGRLETAARLTVLQREGAALVETGRTPELAPGERVMSARLLGERGFVVTFRNVDPLFALDLKDPRAPKVVGALKIPGFSSYLHPLGPNHLLGIGTYVPEPLPGQPVDWSQRGLQLSVFDVSDLSAPRQTHTLKTGSALGFSEAQFDHRAFTFLPERGLLAIPYGTWERSPGGTLWEGRLRSEVQLYQVGASSGIQARGALDLGDMARPSGTGGTPWMQQAIARRSILAEDWLYAVSDIGVRVARIDALRTPAATVLFQQQ